MSDAFKCDRCGDLVEGAPTVILRTEVIKAPDIPPRLLDLQQCGVGSPLTIDREYCSDCHEEELPDYEQ